MLRFLMSIIIVLLTIISMILISFSWLMILNFLFMFFNMLWLMIACSFFIMISLLRFLYNWVFIGCYMIWRLIFLITFFSVRNINLNFMVTFFFWEMVFGFILWRHYRIGSRMLIIKLSRNCSLNFIIMNFLRLLTWMLFQSWLMMSISWEWIFISLLWMMLNLRFV